MAIQHPKAQRNFAENLNVGRRAPKYVLAAELTETEAGIATPRRRRTVTTGANGYRAATRKGIAVALHLPPKLIEALIDAEREARAAGMIQGRDEAAAAR